ncbi:MAG TPA: ABC transporter substrate-binding protein [Stellaceae bacterium]|jgi:iron complex transport system substrate-binding protein|nr:ABC transporter substrate-binding protein [Stellaceae bacterium]
MSLGLRAALVAAMLLAAGSVMPAAAGEFPDSAGRIVAIPDHPNRVMAASPSAEVLVYVLAPQKLVGWARKPSGIGMPARYARLPVHGQLSGPYPTASAATVSRLHPDLIIDSGTITPEHAAFADQIMQQTGVPYILIDNSFDRTPTMLRMIGRVLGVADRGDDLASSAEHAINSLRGRLLIQSATERPRVYYARGRNGLQTAEPGSGAAASIEAAGAINVAASLGAGQRVMVTPQQVRDWNPDVILVEDRSFFTRMQRDPAWRSLRAVRNKKVVLEPQQPFGWIDDPAGVNRLVGLYWLSGLFYPDNAQDDLRALMVDFYEKFYGIKVTDAQVDAVAKTAGIPPSDTPHLSSLPQMGPLPTPGVPGAVNEPGRRGLLPNATSPTTPTTPSYMLPK